MKKIVYINKNELNAIAICRDNYNGVAIQVIRFVDQLVPNGPDNQVVSIKNSTVLKTFMVDIVSDPTSFKSRIQQTIAQAREFLSIIEKQDKDIDGILNDYYSQFKGLNEDGK